MTQKQRELLSELRGFLCGICYCDKYEALQDELDNYIGRLALMLDETRDEK